MVMCRWNLEPEKFCGLGLTGNKLLLLLSKIKVISRDEVLQQTFLSSSTRKWSSRACCMWLHIVNEGSTPFNSPLRTSRALRQTAGRPVPFTSSHNRHRPITLCGLLNKQLLVTLKITAAILSLTVQLFLPFCCNLTPHSEVCRFVAPNVLATKCCQLLSYKTPDICNL